MCVISDLTFLYKCIKHEYNIDLDELGVSQSANNERSGRTRLEQLRPANLLTNTESQNCGTNMQRELSQLPCRWDSSENYLLNVYCVNNI
jgi:hypothetical protein